MLIVKVLRVQVYYLMTRAICEAGKTNNLPLGEVTRAPHKSNYINYIQFISKAIFF